ALSRPDERDSRADEAPGTRTEQARAQGGPYEKGVSEGRTERHPRGKGKDRRDRSGDQVHSARLATHTVDNQELEGVVVDVRTSESWSQSPRNIQTVAYSSLI